MYIQILNVASRALNSFRVSFRRPLDRTTLLACRMAYFWFIELIAVGSTAGSQLQSSENGHQSHTKFLALYSQHYLDFSHQRNQ